MRVHACFHRSKWNHDFPWDTSAQNLYASSHHAGYTFPSLTCVFPVDGYSSCFVPWPKGSVSFKSKDHVRKEKKILVPLRVSYLTNETGSRGVKTQGSGLPLAKK